MYLRHESTVTETNHEDPVDAEGVVQRGWEGRGVDSRGRREEHNKEWRESACVSEQSAAHDSVTQRMAPRCVREAPRMRGEGGRAGMN